MKERRSGLQILLLAALFLWPVSATSQPLLRLATVDNFPPFSFTSQERLVGIDVDVVREMAIRLGLKIEIETYPWVRVMAYVKDGTVDGGFSAFLTAERQAFCFYTGILHFEQFHIFVKKGDEFPFSGVTDLYGKIIGTDIGVFVSKAFETAVNDGKIQVETVNDVDLLNLKKLSLSRIDAMVGDFGVTSYHAEKLGMGTKIVSLGPVHEKRAAYLILSKKSAFPNKREWQEKMRVTLKQIRSDGTYQSILDDYAPKK